MNFYTLVKQNAKKSLSNQWAAAVTIIFLRVAVELLFSIFEMVWSVVAKLPEFTDILDTPQIYLDDRLDVTIQAFAVGTITWLMFYLIITPFSLGMQSWFYNAGINKQDSISPIFEYFSSPKLYLKSIALNVSIGLRVLIISTLFLFPSILCMSIGELSWSKSQMPVENMLSAGIMLSAFVLLIVGLVGICIFCKRYFIAPYLVIQNHDIKVSKAIKQSVLATKGRLSSLFIFELSFLGWYVVSILMLPLFYVMPYVQVSKGLYARYLVELFTPKSNPEVIQQQNITEF